MPSTGEQRLSTVCSSGSSKDEDGFNGCEISHCPTSLDPFTLGNQGQGKYSKGNYTHKFCGDSHRVIRNYHR